MAKWSVAKKGTMPMGAKKEAGDPAPVAFVLVNNGDSTFSVMGADADNLVDISAIATLAVSSTDETIVKVDAPIEMTFGAHAVGPIGAAKFAMTITMNPNPDGSPAATGPFSAEADATTATGGVVTPGPITTH